LPHEISVSVPHRLGSWLLGAVAVIGGRAGAVDGPLLPAWVDSSSVRPGGDLLCVLGRASRRLRLLDHSRVRLGALSAFFTIDEASRRPSLVRRRERPRCFSALVQIVPSTQQITAHAGLVLVRQPAQRLGLAELLEAISVKKRRSTSSTTTRIGRTARSA
jgi:hypothetical protein